MLPEFSSTRCTICRSVGATRKLIGIDNSRQTNAPATPAIRPTSAPSPGVIGATCRCCSTYAATRPPLTTHRQQHTLPAEMIGSADRTPITSPPMSAGWANVLVIVFTAKVGDELLALEIAERVFQLHQLDEQVVLRIEARRMHRTLEIKRQPFLDAVHARAPGEIEKQRQVEDDRRGQNAVAAQEVDLELHRVAEPA